MIASGAESTSSAAQATIDAAPAACTASAGTSKQPGPDQRADVERAAVQHPELVAFAHTSVNVSKPAARPVSLSSHFRACFVTVADTTQTQHQSHQPRQRPPVSRHGFELDGVEVVGQRFERPVARLRDVEEARDRPLAEPRQVGTRGERRLDGAVIAAERRELDPLAPRGRGRSRRPRLPPRRAPSPAPLGGGGSGSTRSRPSCAGS